jgi:hypothetical protein
VLAALAGNVDMVRQQQQAANVAFQEAISIDKEFTVQNTTVQADLEKKKKIFREHAVELGEKLLPVMGHFHSSTSMAMKALSIMIDFVKKYRVEILAAGAAVAMLGGTPTQVGHAVAIVFKNILGLVCDPVAGLVEVPCIKRNGSCALQALAAAELALAGIGSFIPADETIDAMKSVGDSLPCALKETAGGGMATTPTALAWAKKYFAK